MNAKERNIVSDALHAIVCAKMPPAGTDGFHTLNGVRIHKETYGALHFLDPTSDGKVIDALVAALERMVAERHEPSGEAVQQAQAALALARSKE